MIFHFKAVEDKDMSVCGSGGSGQGFGNTQGGVKNVHMNCLIQKKMGSPLGSHATIHLT